MRFHGTLHDVGKHRIRSSKRQQGGLGEEPAHRHRNAVGPGNESERQYAGNPQREPGDADRQQPCRTKARMRWSGRVVIDQRRRVWGRIGRVRPAGCEPFGQQLAAHRADHTCAQYDQRKGDAKCKDRDERCRRDHHERHRFERTRPDAPRRMQDDRRDGWLHAVQRASNRRDIAKRHVDPRQDDQHEERRQHE